MNAPAPADPWLPQPWRVEGLRADTAEVYTLTLAPRSGSAPAFAPGQFNMLYLFGHGEVAISISGEGPGGQLLHTIRRVGAVTEQLQRLTAGATIGVRGPYGNGWPLDAMECRDVIVIAGGLGLAPLRPLVEALRARREAFGRVDVLYGGRRPADLLYVDDLQRWQQDPRIGLRVTVDAGGAGWAGEVGAVTHLVPMIGVDPARTVAVVCGPEVMMRFTVLALQQEGLPPSSIYVSMERHMQCALGYCGHCMFGPHLVCRDGPVFRFDRLFGGLTIPEL